ncbi:uncharacterized protein LOC134197169 [Corticium candelabrum]|uniref:uncharacterized protein LOC134197169 n=1 Tax=Corticium candelabrum TaxID=121492 RepID=UPI002E256903|nr:uncharacterized protein LOC134197169 [Corticium candelabrum]
MPACHSKLVKDDLSCSQDGEQSYWFDLSHLPKKGQSFRGVAIETVNGKDCPVLLFEPTTDKIRTPTTRDVAVALRLADENTRPKFEFITIAEPHPFAGRHYNRYSPSWIKGTRFGNILYKADVEMKILKHRMRKDGDRFVSSDLVYPGLKGPQQFPYLYAGSSPIYLTCRSVNVSKTSRYCLFMGKPEMRITLDSNPRYSDYISSLYDVLGHEDAPALLNVRELPKLVIAAEWLKEKGFRINEDWLMAMTQPAKQSASNVATAGNEQFDINADDFVARLPKAFEDSSVSVKVLPNGVTLDMTVNEPDTKEDGTESKQVKYSMTASTCDYDLLFDGISVKTPVTGNVVPDEDTWSDLYAATITPFWSMEYDESDKQVSSTSWGGCSLKSMETKTCSVKRPKSTAFESTPVAGGSHLSYRNGCIGSVGISSASAKASVDVEMTDLFATKKAQSKDHPRWEGRNSGSRNGTKSRLLGATDTVTGVGDICNENGDTVVDTREIYCRMDAKVYKNGQEVERLVPVIGKLGLHKPSLMLQKKVALPQNLVSELKDTFKCKVCNKTMSSPAVAASCCGSILGCKACLDEYYRHGNHNKHCISCNDSTGYEKTFCLRGIDDILRALGNGTTCVDSAVFAETLKCTVCHSSPFSSRPAVCISCGCIVGCSDCIKTWHQTKDQCPLCDNNDAKASTIRLAAMGSVLNQLEQFFNAVELRSP